MEQGERKRKQETEEGNKEKKRKVKKKEKMTVPVLEWNDTTTDEIMEIFKKHQAILLKHVLSDSKLSFSLDDVLSLFSLSRESEQTFSSENKTSSSSPSSLSDAFSAWRGKGHKEKDYYSFIVKTDTKNKDTVKEHKAKLCSQLPLPLFPPSSSRWGISHGGDLWVFAGVNQGKEKIYGRPIHTDDISHSGTWHLQASGTKVWMLRPSASLLGSESSSSDNETQLLSCEKGDVFLINTRLWWHGTYLPPQPTPSISYARDIYLREGQGRGEREEEESDMTNVEGMYASEDIQSGSVILTEDQMPDCSLPRATPPNCGVCEVEGGVLGLVSLKDIRMGEWFSIAPSSDEEDSDGEEFEFEFEEESDGE